ncbi:MAG: PIG-L family deacetylase, partial [Steroidobacteraceae bacterium]
MLVAVAALEAPVTGAAVDGTVLPPLSAPAATDSILVVAPHPDDETLCCAGFIQRAVQTGARVAIVWATSGDAFELDAFVVERTLHPKGAGLRRLAQQRIAEARRAAALLGVAADRQYFLGYPDRGLRRLMVDHYATPYRSRYTGAMAVPYPQALSPGAAYEGRNLERDLATVIAATRPTLVLAPSPEDRHTDHAVLGELVLRAMERRGDGSRVLTWIVHAGQRWPRPRGLHP